MTHYGIAIRSGGSTTDSCSAVAFTIASFVAKVMSGAVAAMRMMAMFASGDWNIQPGSLYRHQLRKASAIPRNSGPARTSCFPKVAAWASKPSMTTDCGTTISPAEENAAKIGWGLPAPLFWFMRRMIGW